jgi:hypothetical protein
MVDGGVVHYSFARFRHTRYRGACRFSKKLGVTATSFKKKKKKFEDPLSLNMFIFLARVSDDHTSFEAHNFKIYSSHL